MTLLVLYGSLKNEKEKKTKLPQFVYAIKWRHGVDE